MNKLPPKEKIVEAWSAIVDNRVSLGEESAVVHSSNGAKEYTVTWRDGVYTSNDNVSYWQGYAGYPILAVLMLQQKLPFHREMPALFGGVDWTALNQKHKRDYAKAVDEVLGSIGDGAFTSGQVLREVERVFRQLEELEITVKRSSLRPPKSAK